MLQWENTSVISKQVLENHSMSTHFKYKHNQDPSGLNVCGIEEIIPYWRGTDIQREVSKKETKWKVYIQMV